MTETARKKTAERLSKTLHREFVGNSWKWRGTEFFNFGYYEIQGAGCRVEFRIKMLTLTATIESEEAYNVPNSVRMFVGDNAIDECIAWTAEKLIQLYETVSARTAPYEEGYVKYQRALQGKLR